MEIDTELIEQFKAILTLEGISSELSDEDIKLLLESKITELIGYTNIEINPTNHKDIHRNFESNLYEVDFYPVQEISDFKIGSKTLTSDDYILDEERGILYLHSIMSGMLVVEYVSGLSEKDINGKIIPLIFDMGKYMLSTNFQNTGSISSMKEADVSVNYDTSTSLGNLILSRINNLKSSHSCKIKVLGLWYFFQMSNLNYGIILKHRN